MAHGEIFGDTSQVEVWDDLENYLRTPIGGRLIKLVFLDSGFRPGKPFQVPVNRVYEFCRRCRNFVFASKGSSTIMTRPIVQAKLEVNKHGGAEKFGLDLMRLDTDHWKRFVHERLTWEATKRGAWHTSREATDDYFKQVVAETRVMSDGKPKWLAIARDNHYLDCEAMAAAAAYLLNAQYLAGGEEENQANDSIDSVEIASIDDGGPKPALIAAQKSKADKLRELASRLNR